MARAADRYLHLNLFLEDVGHHDGAWRAHRSDPGGALDFEHYRHAAATAERGKFDSLFLADSLAAAPDLEHGPTLSMEPTALLAALAAASDRIGLIAAVSTAHNAPFNLARRFAALDHLSGGRVGWNVVSASSDAEDRNFGPDSGATRDGRQRRGAEFLDVAIKLWDSWEDGAVVADKAAGRYADTERIHRVEHVGEHFRVVGPLDTPRSPQGRPVLVDAGSSEQGPDLAARWAEVIFTTQRTVADGQAFSADLRARAAGNGRDPEQIKVLPGVFVVVGSTEEEARRIERELEDLVPTEPTSRELSAGGGGQRSIAGAPEQIADDFEHWFRNGAADGFNYMPPSIPDQLEAFVDQVVPILQDRGLVRREYEGETLRSHYGLDRPRSSYSAGALAA